MTDFIGQTPGQYRIKASGVEMQAVTTSPRFDVPTIRASISNGECVGRTIKSPLLTYKIARSSSLIRMFVPLFGDTYLRPNLKLIH